MVDKSGGMKKAIYLKILQLLPLIIFILVWHIFTAIYPASQFIFSSPIKFLSSLIKHITSLELFLHASITLSEAVLGLTIGTVAGSALGLGLWYSGAVERIARPYIIALGSVPVFALAPIMIIWFGIGIWSKVMMAALSTIATAVVQSYEGASLVEQKYLRLMEILGAKRFQTFCIVVIPSSLLWVLNSMRLNVGFALLGAFIGEFISSERGLGYLIMKSAGLYDMATVFVGCFTIIGVAFFLLFFVKLIERRVLSWRTIDSGQQNT